MDIVVVIVVVVVNGVVGIFTAGGGDGIDDGGSFVSPLVLLLSIVASMLTCGWHLVNRPRPENVRLHSFVVGSYCAGCFALVFGPVDRVTT